MTKTYHYSELHPEHEAFSRDGYWGLPDEERYCHTDPDEAIEMILDDAGDLEGTLEIVCMVPMKLILDSGQYLEYILERVDEDYGDPDGEPHKPSGALEEAAARFVELVKAEYGKPWACEEYCRVIVDVASWVKEYNPHWLTDSAVDKTPATG